MKLNTLFLCAGILLLFSCQKEPGPGPIINKPDTEDSLYLSKFIEIDTTAFPADTIAVMQFYYDAAKRNIGIDYSDFSTNSFVKSTFSYNGTDSLPATQRIDSYELESMSLTYNYNKTISYFYQGSILVGDSTRNDVEDNPLQVISRNFVYLTDTIIYSYRFYSTEPTTEKFSDTVYVKKVNGNIVEENSINYHDLEGHFTYDSHPNPFNRTQAKHGVNLRFPLYFWPADVTTIFGTNNVVEANQTYSLPLSMALPDANPSHVHYKNIYQYNPNGYPATVTVSGIGENNFSMSYKGLYFYIK